MLCIFILLLSILLNYCPLLQIEMLVAYFFIFYNLLKIIKKNVSLIFYLIHSVNNFIVLNFFHKISPPTHHGGTMKIFEVFISKFYLLKF